MFPGRGIKLVTKVKHFEINIDGSGDVRFSYDEIINNRERSTEETQQLTNSYF